MKKEYKETFDKIKPSKDFKDRLLESVRKCNNKLQKRPSKKESNFV